MPKRPSQFEVRRQQKEWLAAYPLWAPRFWHGMRISDYLKLLVKNRFHIDVFRWAMTFLLIPFGLINSTLYRYTLLRRGRRIRETTIDEPPIFIIGHWRSGTTYLHELMVRDERLAFPTTYECFAPHHFISSNSWAPFLMRGVIPEKRPMDNMPAGFDLPQEDEFALAAMGAPTPYMKMAFPNHPPPHMEFFNMQGADPADVKRFGDALVWFVKSLTLKKKKRLIMKSPPHTGRIEFLSRLFPGAKFIHISRHPYSVIPSTQRLWKALDAAQCFHYPRHEHLNEYIFECFDRMYAGYEDQRGRLPPGSLCEVRYENLTADPVGELRRVYEELDLGDFEPIRKAIEEHAEAKRDYQKNRHTLDAELQAMINERCADYMQRYGYKAEPPAQVESAERMRDCA
jgi:hypothetical protein